MIPNISLQETEVKRKTAEVELAPEAFAIALEAWRRHLVQAQQKQDILRVKNFLTRFVSKIVMGYKPAHMHYTYPIDDLIHLNNSGQLWGHTYQKNRLTYLSSGSSRLYDLNNAKSWQKCQ